jgi:hypothetical protein
LTIAATSPLRMSLVVLNDAYLSARLVLCQIPLTARVWLHDCRNPRRNTVRGNIRNYYCIGPNYRIVSDDNATQYFRTCAHPYASPNLWQSRFWPSADCNLLKQSTIGPNLGFMMNYDAIWMGQLETSANGKCVQGNVSTGNYRPEPMPNNSCLTLNCAQYPTASARFGIVAETFNQSKGRLPMPFALGNFVLYLHGVGVPFVESSSAYDSDLIWRIPLGSEDRVHHEVVKHSW